VEVGPDYAEAHAALFRQLRNSASYDEAARLAVRWSAAAPDTVVAQETAARMCWEARQAEQSIRCALKAIAIEPRWTSYHILASAYLLAGEGQAARTRHP
jgi:hypothetical protein